jgi:uncharacterized membrane protein YidH (DUF202 family)
MEEDNNDLLSALTKDEDRGTPMQAAAIQILLAEKRTSLAVLRTGITVAAVPLSITTVLVTLSRFYSWMDNLQFLVPMYIVLTALLALSAYLVGRAMSKIKYFDDKIHRIREESPAFRDLLR